MFGSDAVLAQISGKCPKLVKNVMASSKSNKRLLITRELSTTKESGKVIQYLDFETENASKA